jgi:predicted AAA+ superfamily ATPase
MLSELFEIQHELSRNIDLSFKRYLYKTINWDTRLIILTGSRGVGKTTLLLQYLKERYTASEESLYISADNILVDSHGLFNIASEFYKIGGSVLRQGGGNSQHDPIFFRIITSTRYPEEPFCHI